MRNAVMPVVLMVLLASGCASVPTAPPEAADKARRYEAPPAGKAGLYVFRDSDAGVALTKDIWVDGKCLGKSAPEVFFFTEVAGGQRHEIATESEFSPNALSLTTDAGRHYFVRQYIRFGVFVGGANLEVVPEEAGKAAIAGLKMATVGDCSRPAP